jgi:hypothetical protein
MVKRLAVYLAIVLAGATVVGCLYFSLHCKSSLEKISGIVDDVQYIPPGSFYDDFKIVVHFSDGRIKVFEEPSSEMFQKGKINIITYDCCGNHIIKVQIADK